MTEERKKLLWEIAREAGLDLTFYFGIPLIKKQLGKAVTSEDRAAVAEARELVGKGQYAEARRLLVRHMMGWGLYDEQMFDEDLAAVVRARLCTDVQVNDLNRWLNINLRTRSRFRNSLTLQGDQQRRMEVIAEYAKLNDADRLARLSATGKLDEQIDERIWNWVRTNIPGITRATWDAIVTGVTTAAPIVWNGITIAATGIRDGAVATNDQLDAWGLALQNYATGGRPRTAFRRTWWQRLADRLFA